jgi:hypothetical protein
MTYSGSGRLRDVEAVLQHLEARRSSFRTVHVLGSLGSLSRRFEDQPRDFVGMGDQREMAGLHLDGLRATRESR